MDGWGILVTLLIIALVLMLAGAVNELHETRRENRKLKRDLDQQQDATDIARARVAHAMAQAEAKPKAIPERQPTGGRMDDYWQGFDAAKAGDPLWENPHAGPTGAMQGYAAWEAGWCYGKRPLTSENEALAETISEAAETYRSSIDSHHGIG